MLNMFKYVHNQKHTFAEYLNVLVDLWAGVAVKRLFLYHLCSLTLDYLKKFWNWEKWIWNFTCAFFKNEEWLICLGYVSSAVILKAWKMYVMCLILSQNWVALF